MAFEKAVRVLKSSEARLWKSAEGIYDDDVVVLFWDAIEAGCIDECLLYLNHADQSVVSAPSSFYDINFASDLYHLHAYYDEEFQRIYRVLMRSPITYAADNWSASTTKWKLYEGNTFTHGPNTLLTLYMQNVTVEDAIEFEHQSLAETYTDAINTLNGDVLSGEWYSIKRKSEVNLKTGLYTLYWFLSKYNNTDMYFKYQETPLSIRGYYYKWEATEETIATLLESIRFEDATGALDPDPDSGTSSTLQEAVIGRTVEKSQTSRDDNDRLFDTEIEIVWRFPESEYVELTGVTHYFGKNINPESGASCSTPDGDKTWVEFKAYVADKGGSFRIDQNEDGTLDYRAILTNTEDSWVYIYGQENANTISGVYSRFSATKAEADALVESLRFREDGSIAISGISAWEIAGDGSLIPADTGEDSLWQEAVDGGLIPEGDESSGEWLINDDGSISPIYSHALSDSVAGWTFEVRRIARDKEDGLFDVEIRIKWISATAFSGASSITIDNGRVASVTEQGFRASEAQVNTKREEYASLSTGTTGKFDIRERGDGLYDYTGVQISIVGESDVIVLADKTVYTGYHIDPDAAAGCTWVGDTGTWAEFKAELADQNGTIRVEWNEDDTLSYTAETSGDLEHSDWTYYSGDAVTERVIVRRNQTDAEIDAFIAALSLSATAGQKVSFERVKDDNEKMSVTIRIVTASAKIIDPITIAGVRQSTVTEHGWSVSETTAEALDASYAALDAGVSGEISIQRNDNGTYDYIGIKTSLAGASDYVALATTTLYVGHHVDPVAGTPCAKSGGNVSWDDFKAFMETQTGQINVEENKDGTISYRATLVSSEDTSLYSRTVRGDGSILGTYFVSGSKEDCESVIDSLLFSDADGTLGTGSTLQQAVIGRTVSPPSVAFDKNDGVYRYTINIEWKKETAVTTNPSGAYDVEIWSDLVMGATSLPVPAELEPSYDIPENYEDTTETTETPVLGKSWHQTTTDRYYFCILANDVTQDFTNTTHWEEHDNLADFSETDGDGAPDDPILGEKWKHTPTGKYYICIDASLSAVFTDANYWEEYIPRWGLWSITRTLTGPSGSGQPKDNGDGTWDYAIVHRKVKVLDSSWKMSSGVDHDTVTKRTLLSRSFQQIEVRVGGDLEFTKGGKNGNELVGIDWNNAWDRSPDNNWDDEVTYNAGDKIISDHLDGHAREFTALLDAASGYGANLNHDPEDSASEAIFSFPAYGDTDGVLQIEGSDLSWVWYHNDGANAKMVFSHLYNDLPWGNITVGMEIRFLAEGMPGDWVSFWSAPRKVVAIDTEPGGEFPDHYYITVEGTPTQADPAVTYPARGADDEDYPDAFEIRAYSSTTLYWWSLTGPRQNEVNPENWVSHGYQARYGDWQPSWVKGFLMGPGSLYNNDAGGQMCRGPMDANVIYQIGDVAYDRSEDAFKIASSAPAYSPDDLELKTTTTASGTAGYAVGAVVLAGGKVYTCKFDETVIEHSHTKPAYSTTPPTAYYYHHTNKTSAPGSQMGKRFWDEGAKADGITWAPFDEDYVRSKIAKSGVGLWPFEQPDLRIPILQELREEVEWSDSFEWSASESYAPNWVGFFLEDATVYRNTGGATAGQSPASHSTLWTAVAENPTGWVYNGYAARHGDWSHAWTKGYITGGGSIRTNLFGGIVCRGAFEASTLYQLGDVVSDSGDIVSPNFIVLSGAPAYNPADLVLSDSDEAPGTAGHAIGTVVLAGSKVYTCKFNETIVEYSHTVPAYGTTPPIAYYFHHTNATSAPGTRMGANFWEEGARGDASGLDWDEFDESLVVSKIATSGSGSDPFENSSQVGVLSSTESRYALSARAKTLRYISPEANPRFIEIYQMTKQAIESVSFDTLFAVDPNWLPSSYWRIETAYAAEELIYADALSMTDGVLTIAYNPERSNFGIKHERIDNGDGTFAVRKTIQLRGPWLPDTDALYKKGAQVVSPNTWGIQGDTIVIYVDLDGTATKPWNELVKSM